MELTVLERTVPTALVLVFLLVTQLFSAGQGTNSEEALLTASVAPDRRDYALDDDISLSVRLTNVSKSKVTVFGRILWGYAGGMVLHVYDASNKEVPAKTLDDDMLVPSRLRDRNSFLVLNPGQYLGTTRNDRLRDLVQRPAKYWVQVEYLSPVPAEFGQGPSFYSRGNGPIWSDRAEVLISK
jgi:hypothetical protein